MAGHRAAAEVDYHGSVVYGLLGLRVNLFSSTRAVGRKVELVFSEAPTEEFVKVPWMGVVTSVHPAEENLVGRAVVRLDQATEVLGKKYHELVVTPRFVGLWSKISLLQWNSIDVNVYDAARFVIGAGFGGLGIATLRWA